MVHGSLFVDNIEDPDPSGDIRLQITSKSQQSGDPPSLGGVNQEVTQIAIETQNLSREMAHAYLTGTAGKQGVFVISGRNSGKTTKVSLLFMQNKPNFQKSQMNVSSVLTTNYENKSNWTLGENKPNQTQF